MRYYRLDTYHGPVLLTERDSDWVLTSAPGAHEVYPGPIPLWCLTRATPISADEAGVLHVDLGTDAGWAATAAGWAAARRRGVPGALRAANAVAAEIAARGPGGALPS